MAMTVYRSCALGEDGSDESVERIARIEVIKPGRYSGVDANISDNVRDMLLRSLRDGSLDIFRSAYAMATLIERFEMTQSTLARDLLMSQSAIANRLRLLRFSEDERDKILAAGLSERHARALLRVRGEDERRRCLSYVIEEGLSVSATERLVAQIVEGRENKPILRKGEIRDLRFFCNSIDRAADLARCAGVCVEIKRHESEQGIEMHIRVAKSQNQEPPS